MARNFDTGSTDVVNLGDISSARFSASANWTVAAFFRVETTTADDRTIIAKSTETTNAQIRVRIDKGSGDQGIEVWRSDGGTQIQVLTLSDTVAVNTWYAVVVTNDSSGNITGYHYNLAGSQLATATASHTTNSNDLTGDIEIGNSFSAADEMDGDIANVIYVDAVLNAEERIAYVLNPGRAAPTFAGAYGLQFFLPLGFGSPEPDFSGQGNTGAVTGTTIGESPPHPPLFGFLEGWPGTEAAAAGAFDFPPLVGYHFRRRRVA